MPKKLAVQGGNAELAGVEPGQWPPRFNDTEDELIDLYRNGFWSFNGPAEKAFAKNFSKHQGSSHCVVMMNGTVTLEAALYALGVGEGDEVIVPAFTWVATAAAVSYVGAIPVFVDIDAETFCIDPAQVEAAITEKTKAILPVHLYGSFADMKQLSELADRHNLLLVEDCAHSAGGRCCGKGIGTIGIAGSFSFQESKVLASGEGGCILTDNDELAAKLFHYKHIGYPSGPRPTLKPGDTFAPKDLLCRNYRATEFQSVILNGQLKRLEQFTEKRAVAADFLRERIDVLPGFSVQKEGPNADLQSYYMFAVLFDPGVYQNVSLDQMHEIFRAEGLPLKQTYGSVYRHALWNLNDTRFRILPTGEDELGACCTLAENVASRLLAVPHQWLLEEQDVLERIARVFEKVSACLS